MKELTKNEKLSISLKDIAKTIREQLKKEFPLCKFSIRTEYYSGGCSLHINLMQSNFKVVRDYKSLTESEKYNYLSGRSEEQLRSMQEKGYHQLSSYTLREEFKTDVWNNGVFLTEQGHNLFKRVQAMSDYFNWDDSDAQIDYFDVKFYLHLSIGKWDKPLVEVV